MVSVIASVKTVFLGLYALYVLIWAVPFVIFSAVLSLGDPQRIVWIDKQLAKDVNKLHSDYQCMMSYNIMSRFTNYCIVYPFIRKRVSTNSIKFKFFMWVNALGYWSFWGTGFFVLLAKGLDIIP